MGTKNINIKYSSTSYEKSTSVRECVSIEYAKN